MSLIPRTAALGACCLLALAAPWTATLADGAAPSPPLDALSEVGSGELSWFGLEVYEARLFNAGGAFTGLQADGPVALQITYRRKISRDKLVETTRKEWRRLGSELGLPRAERVEGWLAEINGIWPDVTPGDQLIALVEPGGPTRFFGNEGLLGTLSDPAFGPAFLGIWLHPETRDAQLRARLMGEKG